MTNEAKRSEESDFERLVIWRDGLINGDLFMGLPDEWYENTTWDCSNGHVSKYYVKTTERGAICPACMRRVVLVPPGTTEWKLASVLGH